MLINRQSPLPLYRQLADILKGKIEAQEYRPGARIPSEPELVKTYRIGRPTIRQALDVLVRDRILLKRKGAGTFVREKPREIDLFSLAGTSSAFLEKGLAISQKIIKKTALVTVPADADHPLADREAYFFSRLSRFEAEPILIEETWLDADLFRGIDRFDFAAESLSRIVKERYHLRPVGCRQAFRTLYDRVRGPVLGLAKPFALLQVARTLNFPEHPAGIFSRLFCRTDRFTFSQELGGTHDA